MPYETSQRMLHCELFQGWDCRKEEEKLWGTLCYFVLFNYDNSAVRQVLLGSKRDRLSRCFQKEQIMSPSRRCLGSDIACAAGRHFKHHLVPASPTPKGADWWFTNPGQSLQWQMGVDTASQDRPSSVHFYNNQTVPSQKHEDTGKSKKLLISHTEYQGNQLLFQLY